MKCEAYFTWPTALLLPTPFPKMSDAVSLDIPFFIEHIRRMKALSDVTKDALELPFKQRFTLARILLDVSESADVSDPSVEDAWDQEIGRRIAGIHDGSAEYKSSGEVFAKLDRHFPG